MLTFQILVLGLTVLFAWTVMAGLKVQERQKAQDARLMASSVTFVASPASFKEESAAIEPQDVTQDNVADEDAALPSSGIAMAQLEPARTPPEPSSTDVQQEAKDKNAAAKKRRRGKRAGQTVAAKLSRMAQENPEGQAEPSEAAEIRLDSEHANSAGQADTGIPPLVAEGVEGRSQAEDKRNQEILGLESQQGAPVERKSSLVITDNILGEFVNPLFYKRAGLTQSIPCTGYGSSGTVVFKGTFQGRAVAVKRLLKDFVSVASREVDLLASADDQ